jgi:hypothetical protein
LRPGARSTEQKENPAPAEPIAGGKLTQEPGMRTRSFGKSRICEPVFCPLIERDRAFIEVDGLAAYVDRDRIGDTVEEAPNASTSAACSSPLSPKLPASRGSNAEAAISGSTRPSGTIGSVDRRSRGALSGEPGSGAGIPFGARSRRRGATR